jgi:hypothetical protein
MDRQEATKLIAEKVQEAYRLINEAAEISDQSGVGFGFNVAYGMGGYYQPNSDPDWSSSDFYGEYHSGWQASSQSC